MLLPWWKDNEEGTGGPNQKLNRCMVHNYNAFILTSFTMLLLLFDDRIFEDCSPCISITWHQAMPRLSGD